MDRTSKIRTFGNRATFQNAKIRTSGFRTLTVLPAQPDSPQYRKRLVFITDWLLLQAGIPIFVTGGIGGVHRGAETTFDVSADLTELGNYASLKTYSKCLKSGLVPILDPGQASNFETSPMSNIFN